MSAYVPGCWRVCFFGGAVCSSTPGMKRDSTSRNMQIWATCVPVVMCAQYCSVAGLKV